MTLGKKFTQTKGIVVNAKNSSNGNIQNFDLVFDVNRESRQVKYDRTIVRNNTYANGDKLNIFYETLHPNNIVIEGSLENQIRNYTIYISIFSLALVISLFWQALKKVLL